MKDEYVRPGSVSYDDPAVERAMATIDGLSAGEQRELIRSTYRAVVAFERTRDIDHLTEFAKNLIATVYLRGTHAYSDLPREVTERRRGSGGSLDIEEVLNRLVE